MAVSLKSLLPLLADTLGVTPAALYERQRALVQAGMLQAKPGRGPGSGVRATPKSFATLLIAITATDSLTETRELTARLAKTKSDSRRCPLTGKTTLLDALTAILSSENVGRRVDWLSAERAGARTTIYFDKERSESNFGGASIARRDKGLAVVALLTLPFFEIAATLADDQIAAILTENEK